MNSGPAIAVMVAIIVLTATAGDVFMASAMRAVGDLDHIKAARGLRGLPLSYPATTGVPIPMTGGVIARP